MWREKKNHFSQDCPKGRRLYHGTRLSSIKGITSKGLQPSSSGRLGPGIYFTQNFDVAKRISLHRDERGGAVFECNVNLGRIKNLGKKNKRGLYKWQDGEFDSARAIHPPWPRINSNKFTEYCLKDPEKCTVTKVAISNAHDDGLGSFVINKMDKHWEKLMHLNNDPTIDDVRNISLATNMPNAQPRARCESVFITVKAIIFLITFVIQVGTVVVQKHTCSYYSHALISLIVFFILLTIGRIINCIFVHSISKLDRYEGDLPFYYTLVMVFGIEMPMMISDAFVAKSCGRVEAWTLALHISYIGHMWLAWIFDGLHIKFKGGGSRRRLFIHIILSFFLPVVMYVPVYLTLGDKAYDFQLDIRKIGGGSTDIERLIRTLLIYFGTIGWGFWCSAFAFIGIGLLRLFPRVRCESVFITMKAIIFLITFVIQVGTVVVQKHTCSYYSHALISLIVFFILLTIGRIINCIFVHSISKLDRYEGDLPFYYTLVMVFGIEMPMMISDAFVVKSCGRVEVWTLALHISYIGHMWLAWIFDSLHIKLKGGGSWCRLFIHTILSFFLPVVMYVPVYLTLGDKAYDFQLDIRKIGGGSTDIERFIRTLLIYFGTIGWGFWCSAFAFIGIGLLGGGIYICRCNMN